MPTPPDNRLKSLERQIWARDKRAPAPVEKWEPEFRGDIDMRIARDGSWHYDGTPINRIGMVQLFATVLRHDPDGKYYLVTPVEKLGITVDDAPFVAVEMQVEGQGEAQQLRFRTNLDDWVDAGPAHPLRIAIDPETQEPSPYVHIRGNLEALIARPVFYDLVALCGDHEEDGETRFGTWSGGRFFAFSDSADVRGDI